MKLSLIEVSPDTTLSLEAQMKHLAFEAGFVSDLRQGLQKILPSLMSKVQDVNSVIRGFVDSSQGKTDVKLNDDQKEAIQKAKIVTFADYGELQVPVPENFKGDLHKYILTLLQLSPKVYSGIQELLNDYNLILASFISNKDMKTSLRSHESLFRRIEGSRIQRDKTIQHFFPKVTGKSRLKMKEIMNRMSDLEPLIRDTVKLNAEHAKQNLQQISTMVQQATDMLKIIHNNLQDNPGTRIGPEATMDISKGAYEVAKEVEHLAAYHYQVLVVVKAVDDICETVLSN